MQNQTSSVVARVEGVRKLYGSTPPVVALDDVTLSIERGEFTAVMGPSGSGKSTLMHVLAGLDTASSGRVFLGDAEITSMSDAELTVLRRRSVGFVFQAFNLVPTLDVRGNIRLPFELDGRSVTGDEEQWIARLIESLGLRERLTHRPHELSGGQQQRVAIARALATRPQLIFADEPTGNLDSRTGREVLSLLRASTREYGQSIAMVTHDPIAAAYADRIVFLRDGAVVDDRRGMSAEEISRAMLTMEGAA
ncbi:MULTISPECIES: ABC transporter ATP-binding protein [unclassified Rathayibacter]|jgi:putative ABC transport system ATP-binding protein|uniref:ABC transporter ATP-binding protein n=1 Tax=unclassified Rathayibacter TaxID=2609250 RepID=UPI000CE81DE5|nr:MULTISPECIES: ABC transporter ATP-binding protein [unclassified Rathayibacter]PPF11228.1 peptide ABC transporter ATP-binding protein [Rathayibacter sp. AY1A5]PPF20004.1 peptide ABC transporter ATP-binding protein [Rathayibacter sp. AY1A7]PPF27014.1 peptide ABC transporter ATP-binding protein [Rathayibacter sp. AY1F2]PPF32887.1 peptide ABC transporter ATP-binding protein [Rathayibacter sp. AY1A3]PPF33328.1 peptide ABC transporter ATP-binding protein [Rathayibacter sp. AY1A2]